MLGSSGQSQIFDPMARALIQQSQTQAPMSNWLQPLGRLAQFGVGHYREKKGREEANQLLQKAFADPNADPQKIAAMLAKNPRTQGLSQGLYLSGLQAKIKSKADLANAQQKMAMKIAVERALHPMKMQRAAAGRTVVTIMNKRETEFAKAMGKADAKTIVGAQKQSIEASDTLTKLQALSKLQKTIPSGPGTLTQAQAAQYAKRFGLDPKALGLTGDQIANVQVFQAISKRLVMQQMANLKGAVSDREWGYLQQQLPNLSNTPEGNQKLIGLLSQMAQRQALKSKMMLQYRRDPKNRSLDGFAEKWNEYTRANPLMPDAPPTPPSTPPAPPKGFKVQ